MENIIVRLRRDLLSESDESVRRSGARFFREEVHLYGIKSAVVRKLGKEYFRQIEDRSKSGIFSLCEELWSSGMLEEAGIACIWAEALHKLFEISDFNVFGRWINTWVNNWAECDALCNHSVGMLTEMYPELVSGLKDWAGSDNRWVRRASAVSLIIPARKGKFLSDIFEIADILHDDTDDMVQKGYGWMLKAASQANEQKVFEYVMSRRAIMPRTALRYAIEKMADDLKKQAMVK